VEQEFSEVRIDKQHPGNSKNTHFRCCVKPYNVSYFCLGLYNVAELITLPFYGRREEGLRTTLAEVP
jgi:hypothetical protein